MKINKKTALWILIPLALVLLAGTGLRALSMRRDSMAADRVSSMVAKVERGDLEVWVTGNGTVAAAHKEEVRTRMTGTLLSFTIKDGQEVEAGDKVATLSYQDLALQIERAKLDIKIRGQELTRLKGEKTSSPVNAPQEGRVFWQVAEGDKVLQGAVLAFLQVMTEDEANGEGPSGSEAEENPKAMEIRAPVSGKVTKLYVAEGELATKGQSLANLDDEERAGQLSHQISLAELQLKQARLDLTELEERQKERKDNSTLYAPMGGNVVLPDMPRGEGDEVPQGTLLFTVVDYSSMKVVIPVDELDINKVEEGQEVRVTAEALPGQEIKGRVAGIASQGKNQAGVATFDVTIDIEAAPGLRAGMSAHAAILVERRLDTLLVPIEAITESDGQTSVMVPEEGQEGRFSPVAVVTGLHDISRIEILDGLLEGQEIVIQGSDSWLDRRFPGMPGGN